MKRSSLALVAVTFLAVVGSSPYSHGQSQNQAPRPAHSRADETLDMWNEIGNKLIAMAQDFPGDKYDFRLQKGQRSSAQNLLHVAGVDYDLMRSLSRSKFGAEFANNPHNIHNSYIWMFVIEHSGITPCEEVSDYEKRLCSFVHRRHSSFSPLGPGKRAAATAASFRFSGTRALRQSDCSCSRAYSIGLTCSA